VKEFNLSPYYQTAINKGFYRFDGVEIPIVSEGWIRIKGYYYLELQTERGILHIQQLTYKLHD
jgi:hypothetical protein